MSKKIPKKVLRHNARRKAVQALYQWDMNRMELSSLVAQFLTFGTSDAVKKKPDLHADPMKSVDKVYFKALLQGVIEDSVGADELFKPYLDRHPEALDPVERAVLRLGAVELQQQPETPMQIVISESVELAKVFGATDAHKYVNGVLDKVAADLRPIEMAARKQGHRFTPPSNDQ